MDVFFFLWWTVIDAKWIFESEIYTPCCWLDWLRSFRLDQWRFSDIRITAILYCSIFSTLLHDCIDEVWELTHRLGTIARWNGFNRRRDTHSDKRCHVCVWERCYHHYSVRRENRGNLSHFLLRTQSVCASISLSLFLYFKIVYGVLTHARMYTINKTGCMFPRCADVSRERRRRRRRRREEKSFRVFPLSSSCNDVREKKKKRIRHVKKRKISLWRESTLIQATRIDDGSIGNSAFEMISFKSSRGLCK